MVKKNKISFVDYVEEIKYDFNGEGDFLISLVEALLGNQKESV